MSSVFKTIKFINEFGEEIKIIHQADATCDHNYFVYEDDKGSNLILSISDEYLNKFIELVNEVNTYKSTDEEIKTIQKEINKKYGI